MLRFSCIYFLYWGRFMKRFFIAIAGIASLLATAAFASDVSSPRVRNAFAAVTPVYSWTGFYVGGNLGYSWGSSDSAQTLSDSTTGATVNGANTKFDVDGVIGGGQAGYNWHKNNWVFGLETDIQGSGQKGNGSSLCRGGPGSTTSNQPADVNSACSLGHTGDTPAGNVAALPLTNNLSADLRWFGTLRGRIGPTITPTILVYVTGGLAYGEVSTTNTITGTNLVGQQGVNTPPTFVAVAASSSNSFTKTGWTIGAGLEGVVSGNWTAKIEYLYIDLGTVSGAFVTPIITPSGGFLTTRYSSHITDNILRVGFNYKWGG